MRHGKKDVTLVWRGLDIIAEVTVTIEGDRSIPKGSRRYVSVDSWGAEAGGVDVTEYLNAKATDEIIEAIIDAA